MTRLKQAGLAVGWWALLTVIHAVAFACFIGVSNYMTWIPAQWIAPVCLALAMAPVAVIAKGKRK